MASSSLQVEEVLNKDGMPSERDKCFGVNWGTKNQRKIGKTEIKERAL